jgi:hypothetical protein
MSDFYQRYIDIENRREEILAKLEKAHIYGWRELKDGKKDALLLKSEVAALLAE